MLYDITLDFLSYLPMLLGLVVVCHIVGTSFLSLKNEKPNYPLSFPIGLLLVVTIFAIILMGGKSIFILLLPFYIFYLFKNNTLKKINLRTLFNNIKPSIIPVLIFFTINYILCLKLNRFPFFEICRDDMYYARVSTFMYENSIESYNIGWYKKIESLGTSQYHFFEMYLNIILFKITSLKSSTSYIFYLLPIAQLTFFHGLDYLRNKFVIEKHFSLFLFFILIALVAPGIKITITLIPFILLLYSLKDKNTYGSAFTSAILLTLNPAFSVLILVCYGCYYLITWIINKRIILSELLSFIPVIFIYLAYITINSIFKGDIEQLNHGLMKFSDISEYYSTIPPYKMMVHYWLKNAIKIFTIFPFIIAGFIFIFLRHFKPTHHKQILFILFGVLIGTSIGSGILHFTRESAQLFQFGYILFVFSLASIVFFTVKKYAHKSTLYIFILFLVSSFIYQKRATNIYDYSSDDKRLGKYSNSYIKEVLTETNNTPEIRVLRFLNNSHYENTENFTPYNSFDGYYLSFGHDQYYFHTYNLINIPEKESLNDFYNYNRSTFLPNVYDYNYFKNHSNLNETEILNTFITEHKINFLLIQDGAYFPDFLIQKSKKKIVDSKSKETFITIAKDEQY